ncbi:hypothetical protein GA0061099_100368 [Bradyrhizobium yuanmingense]|uniref:Uncharacterized protein n=1 Tax=Bradyrhizobium yuanmingense TaxID=108015 RepID=A0A1C3V2E7_9BRAD|nr:hypothetical protein [Bradyrhizobium yuanmingense]TWI26583.1 hypothetical protein IQ15_04018 [Bradyrhizobium yuanmingense]SCB21911.1 hypothetical protein GA0061099_100368 [Bradyrhizobium yuanmingense]
MENQLIVVIDYESPPRAEDIGALFSALAKDYKTVSRGRVLVVANIEHGSIVATLVDWAFQALPYVKASVETAKGAKALADFAKLLKDSITAVKSPNHAKSLPPSAGKRSVHRTMRAMAKTASENHCDIRIKHTEPDGETLEVEITARQAVEIQQVLDPPRAIQEHATPQLPTVREAIGRLYGPGAQAYSESEAQTIADSLFDVLENAGLMEIVPQLITGLRLKGSHTLAEALEIKLNERRGKLGPPLTTR